MKDPSDYITEDEMIKFKEHFKAQGLTRMALLVWTLFRTGRRISEIVGINPKNYNTHYPGLRPCDFDTKTKKIRFYILKKNHVKRMDKQGKIKPDEKVKKELFEKQPKERWIMYDIKTFDILYRFCEANNIPPFECIFPYGRVVVDRMIKKAAKELNLVREGEKYIKNKVTGIKEKRPKQFHPHCFRHGFGKQFMNKNPNDPRALIILNRILDHSSLDLTARYSDQEDMEAKETLDKAFNR